MARVSGVKINHFDSPVGTGDRIRLTWILECPLVCVIQEAYQIQLSDQADFSECLYESGWVKSRQSAHVELPVKNILKSCMAYYIRVRVRVSGQRKGSARVLLGESDFSKTASFVTGVLDNREWKADFISGEKESEKEESASTRLQKQICISGEVSQAYVCTTALGLYHFYINGEKVGQDELTPGWTSYHKHLCYQTYDVTECFREGENTLSALVGAGWYKGKMGFLLLRNNYGDRTAFLMQLVVRYQDGREETFLTDESWEAAEGPVLFSEIYDGEIYDARKEEPVWNRKTEKVEFPYEVLTPQSGCCVQVTDRIPAEKIFVTPRGETVVDFGQNLSGWVECSFSGKEGEELAYKCFETLDAEGNVYTDNLRTAKQEIHYICKGGETVYHPHFTFQGFRYAVIEKFPGELQPKNFTALALHSQMEQTGSFSCSNTLVNQLQHNILWGLKSNFVDIPTDCPQRDERMGWTGDAQIFCRTSCFLMNTYPFFEKWLRDVAADQTPEGGVPHVVPDIVSNRDHNDWLLSQGTHSAAAWADAAVINPWTMYQIYGDTDILEKQYESMKKWIRFMEEHSNDYIWNYRLQFGDWVALDAEEGSYYGATPNDLTCTAYYAYSTGLFARIAKVLGCSEDAACYSRLYAKIVDKFRSTFFDEEGRMTAQTQTAHIVALYFNLVPEQYREKTAARLVELLAEHDGHLVTGFVGTPYFCHALSENGYVDEAYSLLLKEDFPSWLYQIKKGATTVWEHWDGLKPDGTMWSPAMNSFNHYAYGAVGDWLYRVALGLGVDEQRPGYRHSIISPRTGHAFDWAEGSFQSSYGTLKIRWERQKKDGNSIIVLCVTIPANTTARIRLEPGASVVTADGLQFMEKGGIWSAETGSGEWKVEYQMEYKRQGNAQGA